MLSPSSIPFRPKQFKAPILSGSRGRSAQQAGVAAADLEAGPHRRRCPTPAPGCRAYRRLRLSPTSTFAQAVADGPERRPLRQARAEQAARRQQRELTDAKLDRLVAKLGPDRVMAALDRVTAPQRAAAE